MLFIIQFSSTTITKDMLRGGTPLAKNQRAEVNMAQSPWASRSWLHYFVFIECHSVHYGPTIEDLEFFDVVLKELQC